MIGNPLSFGTSHVKLGLCMSAGTGEDMVVLNIEGASQSGIVKSQA